MRTLRTNPTWAYFAYVDERGDWRQAPPDVVIEVPAEAAERGLRTGGLMEVTASDVSAPTTAPGDDPGANGGVAGDGYDGLKADGLRALLAERDLPVSGTKGEMVARLRASDAAGSNEGE